jgi:hypothetical protein
MQQRAPGSILTLENHVKIVLQIDKKEYLKNKNNKSQKKCMHWIPGFISCEDAFSGDILVLLRKYPSKDTQQNYLIVLIILILVYLLLIICSSCIK